MLLLRLTLANLKMTLRNRQALFWSLAFPLIFVVAFGFFFSEDRPFTISVAVVDHARDQMSAAIVEGLRSLPGVKLEEQEAEETALEKIREGKLGFLLVIPQGLARKALEEPPATVVLHYDEASGAAQVGLGMLSQFLEEMNLKLSRVPTRLAVEVRGVRRVEVGFMGFLLPGLAIWGVMSYSIIGLATKMALYREKWVLKRIAATPLRVSNFFAAEVLASLVIALVQTVIIMGVGILLFNVPFRGNPLQMGVLVLLGNLIFLNIGFIVGAFSKSVAAASGIGNAVVLPIVFFSGVFFPTDGLPLVLRKLVDYLPLAPLLRAIRGIAVEGAAFWDYPLELAVVGVWLLLTAAAAVRVFKFR